MAGLRVAVVGSGVAGLASVKSCLEEGLEPVCFEQHNDIGGTFYATEDFRPGQGARAYDSLILNTNKGITCFSDFPFPEDAPPFPTGQDMYQYLKSYAANFGLEKYIQFNTKVHNITRSSNYETTGSWDIETELNGDRKWTTFAAVLVCTGVYSKAYTPNIEGVEKFAGTVEHSQTFKSGSKYRNQRILVVGNAHSAGDVATDVSRYAQQVYLSVGKGTWILNRCQGGGVPVDFMLRRIFTLIPLPESVFGKAIVSKANARLDHVKYKLHSGIPVPLGAVMINDEIQMRIVCGKVRIAGNLARLGTRHAEFDDGTTVSDLDGVIFATGLQRSVPFLDPVVGASEEKLEWYKMVFPVHLSHDTMAMIGFLRTHGSLVPIAELQARLAARVVSKKHKLPTKTVMLKDIDKWNKSFLRIYGKYRYSFPNIQIRDEIAAELGVKPSLLELLRLGPTVAFQYYLGPAFNVHHRLTGPGAWDGAIRACAKAQHGAYANQLRKVQEIKTNNYFLRALLLLPVLFGIYLLFVM
ncbi:flavin-containing monooxygenase 5-like [Haliotis rubra]|uniref:flavin-containing monooxygenase 5-like n=1 Tax=Haliotis rubra TaxID=36100 RepID=UPI001EE50A71|nr:flavin-containing monooxygenase 5-like [Haliotis rubra]XP_046579493.1 flavin-containing monooxygenase 5-like [Haliotis rubra]XP_046579494.1 flavin-containing monooxygenase 5-like [Haliotis rubra]XP_046579495.1 flavin-containing monooxygenase 5-like [Haliotis rubra]XP_046579496.1 flavin-containing monooxygenase 5-like [Haliotis rubra]XP_046579497.1 flavin-containing monooxygenase 5-like [Haliotis rubra]